MPDWRIYSGLSPFQPMQTYRAGQEQGMRSRLFQEELEKFEREKAKEIEERTLRSVAERFQTLDPYLQAQDYAGAHEALERAKTEILADNPNARLDDTEMLQQLLKSHTQGDPRALERIAALRNEVRKRAINRGLVEDDQSPIVTAYNRRTGVPEFVLEDDLRNNLDKYLAYDPAQDIVKFGDVLVNRRTGEETYKGKPVLDWETAKFERSLSNDFKRDSAQFFEQDDAMGRIQAFVDTANQGENAPADLGLIFAFMKLQDPESVVRESEFATAENARGALQRAEASGEYVPNFLYQWINRKRTGESLTPEIRSAFEDAARAAYVSAASGQIRREGDMLNWAKVKGLNADLILGESRIRPFAIEALRTGQLPPRRTTGTNQPPSAEWPGVPPEDIPTVQAIMEEIGGTKEEAIALYQQAMDELSADTTPIPRSVLNNPSMTRRIN